MVRRLVVLLSLSLLALPVLAQNLYRWVDDKGHVTYSDQPPPPKVRKFQEKRLGTNLMGGDGLSYEAQKASKNFPVTLYLQSDCAACQSARDYLSRRGIPFAEVNLKTEEDAAAYRQIFGKDLTVPAVTVGGQKSKGFEAGAWGQLLDLAGYPKAAASAAKPAAGAPTTP